MIGLHNARINAYPDEYTIKDTLSFSENQFFHFQEVKVFYHFVEKKVVT